MGAHLIFRVWVQIKFKSTDTPEDGSQEATQCISATAGPDNAIVWSLELLTGMKAFTGTCISQIARCKFAGKTEFTDWWIVALCHVARSQYIRLEASEVEIGLSQANLSGCAARSRTSTSRKRRLIPLQAVTASWRSFFARWIFCTYS